MNVIAFEGPEEPEVSAADKRRVAALGRQLAAALAWHTGLVARVRRSRGGAVASAAVSSGEYHLSLSAGLYSSLGPLPPGQDVRDHLEKRRRAPRVLGFDAAADVEWLTDSALATEGQFGLEYASVELGSIEEALAWLRSACRRQPVERVPSEEVAHWSEVMVQVPSESGGMIEVSLAEAIRTYGQIYRERIDAAALVANHRLAVEDARVIAEAVRKVAPKKRSA